MESGGAVAGRGLVEPMAYVWAALASREDGAKWGETALGVFAGPLSDEDLLLDSRLAGLWRSLEGVQRGDPGLWVAREMARWHKGEQSFVRGSGSVGDVIRRLHAGNLRVVAARERKWLRSAKKIERGRVANLLRISRTTWRHNLRVAGCPPSWVELWEDLSKVDEATVLDRWREAALPPQG